MTVSKVDLCNAALIKIGQDIPIAAMAESTKAARAFARCFDRVLDLVLARHPWPFTITAVALAPSPDAAFPGWTYRYDVPSDCLTALAVCGADGVRATVSSLSRCGALPRIDGRVDFDTVTGSQATNIITDQPEAYLVYSARITDVGRFPSLFCEALVCRLGMEVAPALAGELGVRMAQTLMQNYEMARAEAIAHAFNEARDQLQADTPSIAARGGY